MKRKIAAANEKRARCAQAARDAQHEWRQRERNDAAEDAERAEQMQRQAEAKAREMSMAKERARAAVDLGGD